MTTAADIGLSAGAAPTVPQMQRAYGAGALSTKLAGPRTRIDRLYQEGCAKIRLPRVFDGNWLEAVLINSSGGLTGGDRITWRIETGAGTSSVVTTQASEKVYKSSGGVASVHARISVGEGARLAWLPQETILFDRAGLSRQLEIDVARGGEVLVVEPVVFGRLAMGERVRAGTFNDRWTVRYDGRIVHGEALSLGPDIAAQLGRRSVLAGNFAMATLLWLHPDAEDHLESIRAVAGPAGVSAWRVEAGRSGKLLARFVAEDGYQLRKRLVSVIELLNGRAGLPKVWSI